MPPGLCTVARQRTWEKENERGRIDSGGWMPMDLTERASRSVVASFRVLFWSTARIGHGTLTALVVMLYNAPRLPPPSSPPFPNPPWLLAPADNNAGKGAASAPAVGFFMVKYDGKAGARELRAETPMFRGLIREFSRQKRVVLLYAIASSR